MNRNLPHAEYLIRTALSLDTPNQAGAVAHALDAARLLVDPERTFGLVLRRTPSGGWARVAEQLTDLEHQAVAWDHACERAGLVAATVRRHIGAHPDVHDIRADGDCVRIELHVADLEQWRRWRAHFGIRHDAETPSRHAVAGESRHAGVRVSVLAFTRQQPPPPPASNRSRGARRARFRPADVRVRGHRLRPDGAAAGRTRGRLALPRLPDAGRHAPGLPGRAFRTVHAPQRGEPAGAFDGTDPTDRLRPHAPGCCTHARGTPSPGRPARVGPPHGRPDDGT